MCIRDRAQVAQIPFVHDVEEGGKFIAVLVITVHAVGAVSYTHLDVYKRQVLGYRLSASLEVAFVLETVDSMIREYGSQLDDTAIVHSDPVSYTHLYG